LGSIGTDLEQMVDDAVAITAVLFDVGFEAACASGDYMALVFVAVGEEEPVLLI